MVPILLKFKTGEFPTVFLLQNIKSSDEAAIKEAHLKIEFPDLDPTKLKGMKAEDYKNMRPTIRQVDGQTMLVKYFNASIKQYEEDGKIEDCKADILPCTVPQLLLVGVTR